MTTDPLPRLAAEAVRLAAAILRPRRPMLAEALAEVRRLNGTPNDQWPPGSDEAEADTSRQMVEYGIDGAGWLPDERRCFSREPWPSGARLGDGLRHPTSAHAAALLVGDSQGVNAAEALAWELNYRMTAWHRGREPADRIAWRVVEFDEFSDDLNEQWMRPRWGPNGYLRLPDEYKIFEHAVYGSRGWTDGPRSPGEREVQEFHGTFRQALEEEFGMAPERGSLNELPGRRASAWYEMALHDFSFARFVEWAQSTPLRVLDRRGYGGRNDAVRGLDLPLVLNRDGLRPGTPLAQVPNPWQPIASIWELGYAFGGFHDRALVLLATERPPTHSEHSHGVGGAR